MIAVNTDYIPGYEITEVVGIAMNSLSLKLRKENYQ